MAEALAVVGIVANIVQLVGFSSKILHRLNEFQASLGETPRSFCVVKSELPLLQHTLEQTREAINAGLIRAETKPALLPAVEGCQEQIKLLDSILEKTLPTSDDSWGKKGRKAILSLHHDAKVESITKILRSYIGILTFYYVAASSTLQPLTDARLARIRQWLSSPDPSVNYQKALKQRQADTGRWFLESDQYVKWKTNAASFLWLHGIPGCGKTILSSTILQNVYQYCANDPGKVVAYFYFDFNDPQKRLPELMVRSLISQLSQQCIKVPTALEALSSSCDNGHRHPSLDSLLEVLQQIIEDFPHSYVILDALDECTNRTELMDILERVAGWRVEKLHVLVTSRKERDIESSLECFVDQQNSVNVQNDLVDKDIQTYIRQRLSDDKSLRKWQKDNDIRQEIETSLMKGAHGMFRWAVCQLDTLGKCRTRFMLRNSLSTLPPTLDETYDRILRTIDQDDSEYALRILQWLAFSARPLLVEEISEVVAIDPDGNPAFNSERVLEDPLDVLNICSSLVVTVVTEKPKQGKAVLLAHYSVKEYLISERCRHGPAAKYSMQEPACNEFIAKSCLGYLLQFQSSDSFSDETIENSKLAQYSAEFWTTHAQAAATANTESLNRMIMKLFSTKNDAYHNWIRIHDRDRPWRGSDVTRSLEKAPTSLYYSSSCGLTEITSLLLLEAEVDVNTRGGAYGTALQAASAKGDDEIVERLLRAGADVNAQDGFFGTALQAASRNGYKRIVDRLLGAGADVNTQDGLFGTALQAASVGGHDEIVERLLKAGADVNAQHGYFGTALQAASAVGHDGIVERLLRAGADVNAQDGYFGTALQAASAKGHDEIVERLLRAGADVNARDGYFGTALQAASAEGHDGIVEQLLRAGAVKNTS